MADLTLRNGIVVTPAGLVRGGLVASGGVITQIGADTDLPVGEKDVDVGASTSCPESSILTCTWVLVPAPVLKSSAATSPASHGTRRLAALPP